MANKHSIAQTYYWAKDHGLRGYDQLNPVKRREDAMKGLHKSPLFKAEQEKLAAQRGK